MPFSPAFFRVFLSSPGDVNEERKAVLDALDRLPNRPAFRERVGFRVIAWDKPGADTPMLATMSPQEAIDAGLPRPSDCDMVITLFYARMGTAFTLDGKDYLSGTHYELLDALNSPHPETLIYHRSEPPTIDPDDDDTHLQYRTLKKFLKSSLFYTETGKILRGVNGYSSPADFKEKIENHIEEIVVKLLKKHESKPVVDTIDVFVPKKGTFIEIATQTWQGSPFPGLRAFMKEDAPIYFGREREIDSLIKRVAEQRFVAVVGASGSGKSSLVGAGLLPRLEANAISNEKTGSKDWYVLRFTPTDAPFASLFDALIKTFEVLRPSPLKIRAEKQDFMANMTRDALTLAETLTSTLDLIKAPAWSEVLVFIDQFEELFTLAKSESIAPFVAMLMSLVAQPKVRVVLTIRHDFVHRAIEIPKLADLLNLASFHLASPHSGALSQMIKRPAERANLEFEDGLPEQILHDTGSEAGSLALMAYTLDELYTIAVARADRRLTFANYEALGGVAGAIGKRAEQTFVSMAGTEETKKTLLEQVFRDLVEVDERGTATRQRCAIGRFDDDELALIRFFTDARLLVMDDEHVEVAHEALFRSWERLKGWIAEAQEDLILLRQVKNAAYDWQTKNRPDFLRWNHERLALVSAMRERLKPSLQEVEHDFLEPEQVRLLRELEIIETTHERRRDIGDRLSVIGDTRKGVGVLANGVPDIAWLRVDGSNGLFKFNFGEFAVKPFMVSQYLVTYAQYEAFVQAEDGYDNPEWWQKFPENYRPQKLDNQRTKSLNNPRDAISWYQAMAFCGWLTAKYRELRLFEGVLPSPQTSEIRLPTEWEWQWMAQNGVKAWQYPWGNDWQEGYANTSEAGLSRAIAVGMYPQGRADCEALDVSGNLWTWCLNDYENPKIVDGHDNEQLKVLRGGSYSLNRISAAVSYRNNHGPSDDLNNIGFCLVCPL